MFVRVVLVERSLPSWCSAYALFYQNFENVF